MTKEELLKLLFEIPGIDTGTAYARAYAADKSDSRFSINFPDASTAVGFWSCQAGPPTSQPSAASRESLVAYLQRPMTDKLIGCGSTNSHQTSYAGLIIVPWELSPAELTAVDAYALQMLGDRTITTPPPAAQIRAVYTSEAGTNALFFTGACERLNQIYHAKGIPLMWHLEPVSGHLDNSVPDFSLRNNSTQKEIMVGEGKFHSVLDNPCLAAAFKTRVEAGGSSRGSGRAAMCFAVAQECEYLDSRKLRYGFLTTYRHTFFIKHVGDRHYAITDAYLCTSTSPSVPEMLFYLVGQVAQEMMVGGKSSTVVPVDGGSATASNAPPVHARPQGSALGGAAKVAKTGLHGVIPGAATDTEVEHGTHTCADTNIDARVWDIIPSEALTFERPLGRGACGVVSAGRLFGQEVAIKCVDACNSPGLVPYLQHEASVLSGRLADLQGLCVPILHACGYGKGGLVFLLATSIINGSHPTSATHCTPSSFSVAAEALRTIHARRVAHGDICSDNIIVDRGGKVWFIDFGMSTLDPTPAECEEELQQLYNTMVGSPGSDKSAREHV